MAEPSQARERPDIWQRLLRIDRRIIYLLLAIGVIVPYLTPLNLPVRPTAPVRNLYEFIEKLPAGSHVLISADYDPGGMPELDPMVRALLHHCFRRDIIPIGMAIGPPGVPLFQRQAEEVGKVYGKQEGVDWVNLGYRPGGAFVVILGIGSDIKKVFASDHRGQPVEKLAAMQGVRNFEDIGLSVTVSASAMYAAWVQLGKGRFNANVAAGVTGVMAPDCYPYVETGQLVGMLGGLKAAAEYETLLNQPWQGTIGMDSQSIAHFVIILFVIIGNIAALASARNQRRRQAM